MRIVAISIALIEFRHRVDKVMAIQDRENSRLQAALAAMGRGGFRQAELLLQESVRNGDHRIGVKMNLALALVYQGRYWEGAINAFQLIDSVDSAARQSLTQSLRNAFSHQQKLWRGSGMGGEAEDCSALSAAFDPFPDGPLAFAARWIPRLSSANQMRAMVDFALWCRHVQFDDPLAERDIRSLMVAANKLENAHIAIPMLCEGLQDAISAKASRPESWTPALQLTIAMKAPASLKFGLAINDLLGPHADWATQRTFLKTLAGKMLRRNSTYRADTVEWWLRAAGDVLGQDRDLAARLEFANWLYDDYRIEQAEDRLDHAIAACLEVDAQLPLDLVGARQLMQQALFGLSARSGSLLERGRLESVVTPHFLRLLEREATKNGWRPINKPARGSRGGRLKIGWLCHTVGRHSVGFLLEQMVRHHSDSVDIHLYDTSDLGGKDDIAESTRARVAKYGHYPCASLEEGWKLAQRIAGDDLDVLVDWDAVTRAEHAFVMYFRPAPVQCVYAGGDSCGYPFVDAFIADPYVLPEHAQDHYVEKILRLPRSVYMPGGYAGGVAERSREPMREALGLSAEHVAYLVSAPGRKITRDMVDDCLEVLHRVGQGVLLVKGAGRAANMRDYWLGRARERGVDTARLMFLPYEKTQEEHRARLRMADVTLDTHPYNGATHSFEQLWAGLPVVTLPGDTFVSRVTYSLLRNLGVSETVCWDRQSYVATAARLGTDRDWRQSLSRRLQDAVSAGAGIWDTRSLVLEFEDALRALAP
jgi:hypothetical protein